MGRCSQHPELSPHSIPCLGAGVLIANKPCGWITGLPGISRGRMVYCPTASSITNYPTCPGCTVTGNCFAHCPSGISNYPLVASQIVAAVEAKLSPAQKESVGSHPSASSTSAPSPLPCSVLSLAVLLYPLSSAFAPRSGDRSPPPEHWHLYHPSAPLGAPPSRLERASKDVWPKYTLEVGSPLCLNSWCEPFAQLPMTHCQGPNETTLLARPPDRLRGKQQ